MERIESVTVVTVFALLIFGVGIGLADEADAPILLPFETERVERVEKVVVERGDHLWKISERALTYASETEPTDSVVSPYWRQVIDSNRNRLRSGDPDLIYPGEIVVLPAIE